MGVAAEIIENGLGRTERLFRIDNPVLLAGCFDLTVGRWDFSCRTTLLQPIEKLATKHPAQSLDQEQKVSPCIDPAVVVQRQSAGGNQTVEMKMIVEGLVPSMQD